MDSPLARHRPHCTVRSVKAVIGAIVLVTAFGCNRHQTKPDIDAFPELTALRSSYSSALVNIQASYEADKVQAFTRYLTELQRAETDPAFSLNADAIAAIKKERKASPGVMPKQPSSHFPNGLLPARMELLEKVALAKREFAERYKALQAQHLAKLSAFEARARQQGNSELIQKLTSERARIIATPNSESEGGKAKNSGLVNGDFSRAKPDGAPEGWTSDRGGVKVIGEGSERFARFSDGRGGQFLKVPKGAKRVQLSVRIRCADLTPASQSKPGMAGVGIYAYPSGSDDKKPVNTCFCSIKEGTPNWKRVAAEGSIPPNTSRVRVWMERWYCTAGTVDVDDVKVSFR